VRPWQRKRTYLDIQMGMLETTEEYQGMDVTQCSEAHLEI